MKTSLDTGRNRTGLGTSPLDAQQLLESSDQAAPSQPGDDVAFAEERERYARAAEPVGSMPPPSSPRGIASAAVAFVKREKANVLLDKLGERLGFERTGVRLYELLLSKLAAFPSWPHGPTHDAVLELQRDELRHFALCKKALEKLGADPTAVTPSADLAAMLAQGVPLALADPRTDLLQGLQALLMAELTDHASWELLVALAQEAGEPELAAELDGARAAEARHLARVRGWLESGLKQALGFEGPARGERPSELEPR